MKLLGCCVFVGAVLWQSATPQTAVLFEGARLIIGDGHVGIHDGKVHGNKPYYDLSPGDRFDLHTRSTIPVN